MKSGALRRAIGLTFLYIGGFVLLVTLQFSRGPGFSEKFGRLSVTAAFPKADRTAAGRSPDSIRLDYAGFSISMSRRRPAFLVAADGSSRPVSPRSIEKRKDGVRILLEGGVELRAAVGADERFSLSAAAPSGAATLRLPYAVEGRARLASDKGAYRLESGGASFDLAFASSSIEATGFLALSAVAGADSLGRFAIAKRAEAPAKPGKPPQGEQLVAQAPKDPAAFKAEVDAWRDKAWAGLSAGRYDAERLAWRGKAEGPAGAGESRFSERALAAYLAESLLRGSYGEALARMRSAKERWPSDIGYLSAPYLGGIVRKMQALESADQAEAKRLAQLLLDKSPELFAKEGLLRFLFDRAGGSLAPDALKLAASLDPAKLTTRQAVGLLGCVVESRSFLKEEENPFKALGGAADKVLGAVRKSGQGLFLVSEEDGSTDTRLSLLAGQHLIAYGAAAGKEALVGLGQGLVEGFLALSDEQGIAASRILVREGAVEQRAGALLPEEAYPLLASNPYYPREVSFYREIGPGTWAWTCAPSLSVSASELRDVFSVSFPEGRSHYLAFYGIRPFTNIQLYDIDYSPDAEFEIYDASGYLYNKPTKALYMKMKHKKESESIKLFF